MKILLIDNNKDITTMLSKFLNSKGFELWKTVKIQHENYFGGKQN